MNQKATSRGFRVLRAGVVGVLAASVGCSVASSEGSAESDLAAVALGAGEQTIFGNGPAPTHPSDADGSAVELGLKFRSSATGSVTGVRFYKGSGNGGVHLGHLWKADGSRLASVTFSAETSSGWQTMHFPSPIAISANTTYVVSYYAPQGHYAGDDNGMTTAHTAAPLTALADGTDGPNDVYRYGASGFPTSTYAATNYYVDVVFRADAPMDAGGTDAGKGTMDSGSTSEAGVTVDAGSGVPCALNAGAESCWAAHTGVPGYTEAQILAGMSNLTHKTGDLTITQDGTVIDGVWLDGCIAVRANNVTIKRSLIRSQGGCQGGNGQASASAVNSGNSAANGQGITGLVIQDTEVDGMNPSFDSAGIGASDYRCTRCNVHGFHKNFWLLNNAAIVDSYSHDLASPNPSCIHAETVNADSATNVSVVHSFLKASGADGCVTGALMNGGSWGPGSNVTIDRNYLEGTAGADAVGACGATQISYTNNAFSNNNGYSGTLFIYGFNKSGAGNVWSGNFIPETGAAMGAPGGC